MIHFALSSIYIFVLLVGCTLPEGLFAAEQDHSSVMWYQHRQHLRFQKLTTNDGLSQSSVLTIVQDSKGFMWFGTEDGLNRYDGHVFKKFKHKPGDTQSLQSNRISDLVEDNLKNLWVGTEDGGLHRYHSDKEQFSPYLHDANISSTISDNGINVVFETEDHHLWIGTRNGLNLLESYDRQTSQAVFRQFLPNPSDPHAILGADVTAIHEDRNGNLWVGTRDGGLNKVLPDKNNNTIRFENYSLQEDQTTSVRILSLGSDKHQSVWIGTETGLYRFVSETGVTERFQADPGSINSLGNDIVREIYEDRFGTLWFGTDGGGLNRLEHTTIGSAPQFVRYKHNPHDNNSISQDAIESIYEDHSGNLWIGTFLGGINKLPLRMTPETFREEQAFSGYSVIPGATDGLSHNSISAIQEDRYGRLWVGTDGDGINLVTPAAEPNQEPSFAYIRKTSDSGSGISDNVITSFFEDSEGILWIGTYTGGLDSIDLSKSQELPVTEYQFEHFRAQADSQDGLSSNFIRAIHEDHEGYIWIGTIEGGLSRYDKQSKTFKTYKTTDSQYSISDNNVLNIFEDSHDRLWIGTFNGLNIYDRDTDTFTRYFYEPENPETSLSYNFIRCIIETSAGQIWIGTGGGGVNIATFGADQKSVIAFKQLTEKNGLPSDVVSGVLEDQDGKLWISTNHGISKFDPETSRFTNFDQNDGLLGNEFILNSYYKNRSGELFFGSNNGFNIIFPPRQETNNIPPPVVLTDFKIFNKSVPIGDANEQNATLKQSITETSELKLSCRDYVFTVEFAALDFTAPEKNEYSYIMEGLDHEWIKAGNRNFATYTTLPHGDYIFRVKASNSTNVWNDEGLALKIKILPPFYKETWFLLAVAIVIIFLVAMLYVVRLKQLHDRKQELEQLVQRRTSQLDSLNIELQRIATQDAMTGIANYRKLRQFLEVEVRRCIRDLSPLSIIILDVDYFKFYNDTYGHQSGDECLREIAHVLDEKARRPGDLAARYGGEEFIVALSGTDKTGAIQIAEEILRAVENLQIPHGKSEISDVITVSIGGSTIVPQPTTVFEDIIKVADNELYKSKAMGRNQVSFH